MANDSAIGPVGGGNPAGGKGLGRQRVMQAAAKTGVDLQPAGAASPGVHAAAFGPDLAERDLDFLLLEEAAIDPGFLLWLFTKAGVSVLDVEPLRLERSVSTYA